MRITYIAAGAAGSYCGACKYDVGLVLGLRARGEEVELVPLYTPLRTDGPDPSVGRIFYGGVNAYLQQHLALFRRSPACLDWLLDRPALLRLVSRFAVSTRPEKLGAMTVSVLQGPAGHQRKELEKLLGFLNTKPRPDIVHLTNSLLSGLAPTVKARLGVPVLCTLQGEESFVDRLPDPHRKEAIDLLRRNADAIDLFVAPCQAYAQEMVGYLRIGSERVTVVRPGIDVTAYARTSPRPSTRSIAQGALRGLEGRPREPFRIAYLSRIAHEKGLDLLVDAFRRLEREPPGTSTLAIAGQLFGSSKSFWQGIRAQLEDEGLWGRVEYAGELDFESKVRFFRDASVFCQPSRVPDRRGMAALEALASGTPVVLPDRGVFPELVALTGGGLLVPGDDPEALAEALRELRDDPDRADRLGEAGAAGVRKHFSLEVMVSRMLEVYETVLSGGLRPFGKLRTGKVNCSGHPEPSRRVGRGREANRPSPGGPHMGNSESNR